MILTTTPTIEGRTITEYRGVVFGEVITGVNFIKDFAASIRDFVGGRSSSYEDELLNARAQAMRELEERANKAGADDEPEGNVKGFYRGAFDSIPFLNDDAKRTFVHLLLRPGYMIRDYIKGKHDIYLAPLTSLIIFYAFFSLVSSIAHPDFEGKKEQSQVVESDSLKNRISISLSFSDDSLNTDTDQEKTVRMSHLVSVADTLMFLNRYPEAINSRKRASLAAFESALRSQGINYFLGIFLLMWPAMHIALRKQSVGWAASATASAYILCQFSFFMLFVLILSLGQKNEIGLFFMGLLIMIDYHQLLETSFRKSLWLTVKTGLYMGLFSLLFVLLVGAVLVMIT